jgi:hypothetical protein
MNSPNETYDDEESEILVQFLQDNEEEITNRIIES